MAGLGKSLFSYFCTGAGEVDKDTAWAPVLTDWEQGKTGQCPPRDSDLLSCFWPASSQGYVGMWPDHTSQVQIQIHCEAQQELSGTDTAGPLPLTVNLTSNFTLPSLCPAEYLPLAILDTLNTSLLEPNPPVAAFDAESI